jgi:serine/threonine-protein kinase
VTANADRHLLFGLLALQNGIINQVQLLAAFQAWTLDKSKSLADHLEERGDLTTAKRALLEALADVHVEAHGGDVEKSLAVFAVGRSTRESLVRALGTEIEASLGHVAAAPGWTRDDGDDTDRTCSYVVGTATSDGQRFRILRPHARGGLGAVFVALDGELHREVALKQILEKHADDPVSRQRFIAEAEITGGLEHPGVVPVYGLGTDSFGRPYYAMRFIKGDSLKEAIEAFHQRAGINSPSLVVMEDRGGAAADAPAASRDLALRKLLRRFTDVCNAIDYAHSRGVIHRDIKPANIIVGKYGETLVVDWGLAKSVGRADPSAGEQTLAPSSGGSSETLPGSALGTPAYMSPEQARGELNRLGPRSDVYSLGATLYCLLTGKPPVENDDLGAILGAVQQGQFPRPSQHDPALDKALEAICLKAMAKEPDDRYPTPRALADELDRWMADEPVAAWREPLSRRARRWARRNRTAVTAAAGALVAGVVGLSAVLAVQTQAKADIARSLNNEMRANIALAESNKELTRSQAAVQARYDLAVDAIKTFHTGVSEDFLLKQDQFKEVRDRLLKSASDFYGKLGALLGKESDLGSRRELWQANYEVADLTGKVGKKEDALAAHRQVLTAREGLAAETQADPGVRADVGRSLLAIASLLEATGQTKEAEGMYRKAETLLVELTPTIAEAAAVRAVLADCRSRLGSLLDDTGHKDEALSVYDLARAEQEALAAARGATPESRRDLADTICRVASLLDDTSKSSEAEAEYHKALAIQQKLAEDNPAVTEYRNNLADSHTRLGSLLNRTGKGSEAVTECRTALAIQQKLADDNPAVSSFRSSLATSHIVLGNSLPGMGKLTEAVAEFRKAIAIEEKLADDNPAVSVYRRRLAASHNNLCNVLLGNDAAEAASEGRKALAILQKLADDSPAVTVYRDGLAAGHFNLGQALSNMGKSSEAEAECRKALAIRQKLADDNPAIARFQGHLAFSLNSVGRQLAQSGELAEAIDYYIRAEAIQKKFAEASSATFGDQDSLANCLTNTADVLRRSGRHDEALAACERALAIREPLVEAHLEDGDFRLGLGETYLRLGQVRYAKANLPGAAAAWKRALAHYDGMKTLDGESTFLRACCHAGLSGLAGRPGSGVSAAEGADQAEKAVALLRQAFSLGYRNPFVYRTESALDPLRNSPDFQLLMMDLVFPPEPFPE